MWTTLRQEIEKTRTELHLKDRLKPGGLNEWKGIEDRLYDTFSIITVHNSRPTWIWENLKVDNFGIATEGQPYRLLNQLLT